MTSGYLNYSFATVPKLSHTLSVQEQERWQLFCQQRLTDPAMGAPLTLDDFSRAAQELSRSAKPAS